MAMATQQQPHYVSFNNKVTPGVAFAVTSPEQVEDMKQMDPPLRHGWTIWEQIMQTPESKAQYSDATHRIASFNTVKGFWRYWNHLPQPSELVDGKKFVRDTGDTTSVVDALMVFRNGIKPEWEDPVNASGGHFQFQLKPSLGDGKGGIIDEYWNNIVLGMIGGTLEPADMVTGARLVDKLGQTRAASIRIEVWFSNFEDTEKVDMLQRNLEKCMSTRLDGTVAKEAPWGKTDRRSHAKK
mmetsp:Transcript_30643/g.55990  ORF Transcript_30643/g.55990 Transcript_30643/m.55990 type:complete len:240 (+) Transcript_30643:73-792(+)